MPFLIRGTVSTNSFHTEMHNIREGCLAGSFGRACGSWSRDHEFEPHIEYRVHLKIKLLKKIKQILDVCIRTV